jgi:hypothetical protein
VCYTERIAPPGAAARPAHSGVCFLAPTCENSALEVKAESVHDAGMTYVIGIAGKAGVGKTTFANHLKEHLDDAYDGELSVLVVSFAAPLKAMLAPLGPFPEDKQAVIPHIGLSYRQMCQTVGDWGRGLDPDFWVKPMRRFIAEGHHDVLIIDDVRLENESVLCTQNGTLVRLKGDGYDLGAAAGHVSELADFMVDREVPGHQTSGWPERRDELIVRIADDLDRAIDERSI